MNEMKVAPSAVVMCIYYIKSSGTNVCMHRQVWFQKTILTKQEKIFVDLPMEQNEKNVVNFISYGHAF